MSPKSITFLVEPSEDIVKPLKFKLKCFVHYMVLVEEDAKEGDIKKSENVAVEREYWIPEIVNTTFQIDDWNGESPISFNLTTSQDRVITNIQYQEVKEDKITLIIKQLTIIFINYL